MSEIIYIQYNKSNKDWARENRTYQTKAEQLLRGILRKKQL
jgi:very-short-patch-repair endonuclease